MSAGQAWNNARRVLLVDVNNNALVTQPGNADDQPATDQGLVVNSRLHLFDGTNWDRARGAVAGPAGGTGYQLVALAPAFSIGDGASGRGAMDAAGNAVYVATANGTYNGATWDRQRGNVEGTLLASAARVANADSAIQTNHNARGVALFLNVSVWGGAGSLTVSIRGVDPVSAVAKTIAQFTAVTAADLFPLTLYPGATAGAGQSISGVLPRTWWVRVSPADGTSHTYSVGYSLIV